MKKHGALLISLFGVFSSVVNATESFKLGYVNFEVAFAQEQEAQKYTVELEKEDRAINEKEIKARADIEAKVTKFQASAAKLSDKARQEQQVALGEELNKAQESLNQLRNDFNQKRQRILTDLENKNRMVLESVSRKDNYSVVLNSMAIVYVSDDIKKNDVTAKLVAEYNKLYPVKAEPAKKATPAKTLEKPKR